MANKFNASMFEKIKDTLKKSEKTGSGAFSNIMKFPAGYTYTVRLIPNVENIDDTFFHHYTNQWISKKDGSFVSALSLRTFGQKDPIQDLRWRLYKKWKESNPSKEEKFENPIKEKENWFVNILILDDPQNSENNGKIKILNVGPQLKEIIDEAMTGERADEFGPAIFDLSNEGADFKIKADKQGVYTTFKGSYFTFKGKHNLSDEDIDNIYGSVHDLKQVFPVKTFEELTDLINEHFFVDEDSSVKEERKPLAVKTSAIPVKAKTPVLEEDVDDDIPFIAEKKPSKPAPKSVVEDDDTDRLLQELDLD